ncbi:MAG: HAD-IIIC family phosphatase [Defluviitaleaceae bacterium]|nr:HAD-IIIC family phosphatase [Defluviitaleaceae bacterium]MCL2238354.1 HAD-IIIC family phosphatase [Defluviitaleaceae bacterium]
MVNEIISYPFDSIEIIKKKKAIKRQLRRQDALLEVRIAIMSGSTVGVVSDVLELFLLYFGIKPIFFIGNYNRYYEELLFENRELFAFSPDIIYIHTSIRNVTDTFEIEKFKVMWDKIREVYACTIIQNNFELPGYYEAALCKKINEYNVFIADYALKNNNFYVNDIQFLSAWYGLGAWLDAQDYMLYKYALSIKAIPHLSYQIAKIIKSMYGKNQKCLVLDLDDTLWGGIVGEIGTEKIEIGSDTALGEGYKAFQKYVKTLHEQGIILAVCSKNEEKITRDAFNNPNMVLSLEDITVFCANWDNKADNIKYIAAQLNILPESIVFIDDNPAERELIRQAIPQVKVPEVNNVVDFIRHIEEAGYFYTTRVTEEDKKRNQYYANEVKRANEEELFADYSAYLRSLCMTSEIEAFSWASIERIVQLINKTNQFNFTTRRYSIHEINDVMINSQYITLYGTLDDKFGSNGIVSAIIGKAQADVLHITLWVMSCRVFKRDMECAMLDRLVKMARDAGISKIVGCYYPSAKNGVVRELYKDMGFNKTSEDESGNTVWALHTSSYVNKNKVISVTRGRTV